MGDSSLQLAVDTPRGPVAAYRCGSGPPLLLVAGLGSSARLWGELPRLLSRRFTVLTLDNRGVGGSRGGDAFTLDGAVEDLAAVLRAASGTPAGVLGVSMGGLLGALLAARHRELVQRLVVASCAARHTATHARMLAFFRTIVTRLPPAEAGQALMTFAFAAPFLEAYPGFVDEAARLWAPESSDVPGVIGQIDALRAGFDARRELASVSAPTLVLAGEMDPIVPAAATRELADSIPGASFRAVAGAAHSVLAEGGAEVLELATGFLAGGAAGDGGDTTARDPG